MAGQNTWWEGIKNSVMDSSGNKKKRLISLMATNNRIYADMISKLRLLDRKRWGIDKRNRLRCK
jgi:hypothetical protein